MYNGCLADACADSTGQTIETFDLSKELLCSPERVRYPEMYPMYPS